jgi:nitrate/nitrite transporter NarK
VSSNLAAMFALPTPKTTTLLPRSPWAWLSGALGLALWLYWSALVAQLPTLGFGYSANQLYWLAALPPLAMACTRVLAALLPPVVAGSQWSAWTTAALLPLAVAIGTVEQRPDTPYEAMVLLALLCGAGAALFVAAVAPVGAPLAEQAGVLRRRATWVLCCLAVGSFGSLVGLAAASALLASAQFPPGRGLACAGVLLALLLQQAVRGAAPLRLTLWAFAAMALGAAALWIGASSPWEASAARGGLFVGGGGLMFVGAGLGAAGTFALASATFADAAERRGALGLIAALGAFGGFVLPKCLGTSLALTGGTGAALLLFVAFYLTCLAIAWRHYGRRFAPPVL